MLVEKNVLAGQVVVLKLITGEEIIARAVEELPGAIKIRNPLSMVMMPGDDKNQGMVAFAPWVLGAEDDFSFDLSLDKVLVATKARADAAGQYSQAIGEDTTKAAPRNAPQSLNASRGGRGGRG